MKNRKAVLLLTLLCAILAAQSAVVGQVSTRSTTMSVGAAQPLATRQTALSSALGQMNLSADQRRQATADFEKLPAQAQEVVLCKLLPKYAEKAYYPSNRDRIVFNPGDILKNLVPTITSFYPAKHSPGYGVAVIGNFFNANCKVYFDGVELATYPWSDMLVFVVPAGKTCGVNYPVYVKNTSSGATGNTMQYKVVAPMGYRGVNGFNFANFGTPQISWNVFRDYFTPAAVEYSNGSHRYSAQAWYDSSYKGVGGGGDCYGMSVRSIRAKMHSWQGLYGSWWSGNVQASVWDYARIDPQVLDSVREDQGGQISRVAWDLISYRWNSQSHNAAWEFIRDALASYDPMRQPIMCVWGPAGGHAIVAYRVEEVGDDRRIYVYDNNKPYRESETSDGDSVAHVSKSTGKFTYAFWPGEYANKMLSLSYNETIFDLPLLPVGVGATTGATASAGSETTVAIFDNPNSVSQITDEQGHTMFAGGKQNMDAATRIPNSMRFIPLTGAPTPPGYPAIFIFSKSTGKSLTFDIGGNKQTMARIFSPGRLIELTVQSGKFRVYKLQTADQELQLSNVSQMNLGALNVIAIRQDSEQMFQLQGLRGIQQGTMNVRLQPSGAGLAISGNSGARLNLTVKGLSNTGAQQSILNNITVPAGRSGQINVPNFNNLRNTKLNLQLGN